MYEWESNSDTVICLKKQSSQPGSCEGATGGSGSSDSSISDRWMSIVGRVNDEPLLEDEAVPVVEFSVSESSPESHRFESFDNTLLEPEPKWRLVSDESFIKMEQMVMSPVKTSEPAPEFKRTDIFNESNFIVFSPFKKTDDVLDVSKNKESDNTQSQSEDRYDTCESYDSNIEIKNVADTTNICNNTLEDMDSYLADSEGNSNANSAADDSPRPSQNSAADESLKFNDTLEEMEHLIKFGMNYIVSKPEEQKLETKENYREIIENDSPAPTLSHRSPVAAVTPKCSVPVAKKCAPLPRNSKENKFKLRSPRFIPPSHSSGNISPFKLPNKTPSSGKKFFYKSPPSVFAPKAPPKFENILSPVQYYINNSPVVPKIKNISPGFNLWEKHAQRAASSGEAIRNSQDREQVPLQKKAYKAPKTTKLLETPPKQRLPRNFKVELMAESLPKPTVIKHERRENISEPLREHNSQTGFTSRGSAHNVDESFANLALTSGDLSLCVKKPAVRSHTLK